MAKPKLEIPANATFKIVGKNAVVIFEQGRFWRTIQTNTDRTKVTGLDTYHLTKEKAVEEANLILGMLRKKEAEREAYQTAKAQPHTLKVGDVMFTEQHYDETTAFYAVIVDVNGEELSLQSLKKINAGVMHYVPAEPLETTGEVWKAKATGLNSFYQDTKTWHKYEPK